ncbi:MAG: 50S ribosomal protein L4 [Bacillota bacterium]|jgi:large subunit ribosomal protein L4|nr:50S ribosomal protein L4 [Bacillota bacterium]MDI9414932.1 50S ribosomal protein L4 [Bacillota bacterium]NLD12126.1 50S ribosomal protein L4 [Bacillota bacterium]HAV21805.1 50S ribosomal protein L4 [Bacillota bacterium]HCD41370.1 50S ribosomal protein L4 [Bacillota bacterium]
MPTAPLYNMNGEKIGDYELPASVFGVPVNEHVLHEAVVMQLASERLGTAKAKTRSEVAGGGSKPWRQKGTGRARHGSRVSPIWRGGGITFGPRPRKYRYNLPKKARRIALLSALSSKAENEKVLVIDGLTMPEPKTRVMANMLEKLDARGKALVILKQPDSNVELSFRNIPGVKVLTPPKLNVYDILNCDKLLLAKEAADVVEEVLVK